MGSLVYVMRRTRLDIYVTVDLVSKYQSNPTRGHWRAVKIILRYLKGTTYLSLCYRGSDLLFVGYSDTEWGGDLDECKST